MSIKQVCYFSMTFVGDGTSTTENTNVSTSPFIFGGAGSKGDPKFFSPLWNATSPLPTGVQGVNSSDGQTCTVTIGLLGAVTFSWPVAIPNGTVVTVDGLFEF